MLPSLPDLNRLERLLSPAVQTPTASRIAAPDTVAIFQEPGFPSSAMPPTVAPQFIAASLQAAGCKTVFVSAAELSDPRTFISCPFGVLIFSYGETFPLSAYANLASFAAGGGGFVFPAGIPLTVPCEQRDGRWEPVFPPASRDAIINMLFRSGTLPAGKYYETELPSVSLSSLESDIDASLAAAVSGDSVKEIIQPDTRFSLPLLAALSKSGEVNGLPVVLQYFSQRAPAARYLFCSLSGEHHPWSPSVSQSPRLIAAMVEAVRRNRLLIEDVFTELPGYRPGEIVQLTVRCRSFSPIKGKLRLTVHSYGAARQLLDQQSEITAAQTAATAIFRFPAPAEGGRYDLIVSFTGKDGNAVSRTGLVVTVTQPQGKTFSMNNGDVLIDGCPVWVSGANIYNANFRSPGVFFSRIRRSEPFRHPVPGQWFDDLSLLTLCGANAIRQHYLEYVLDARNLTGNYSYEHRLLDAFLQTTAEAGVISFINPLTFFPCLKPSPPRPGENLERKMADPANLAEVDSYLRELGKATSCYRNIAWEIINEPDLMSTESKTSEQARQMTAKAYQMLQRATRSLLGDRTLPVGVGNAHPPLNFIWNTRDNLRFLAWTNTHYYGPIMPGNRRSPEFGLNFGYPSLLGEFGQPGGVMGNGARLGVWHQEYAKILAMTIAERSLGFTNFYLAQQTGAITSPEWGFLRQDQTEREDFKVWKKWNVLLRHLPRENYLRPNRWLAYHTGQLMDNPEFIHYLNDIYYHLQKAGIHCVLMNEQDISAASAAVRPEQIWLVTAAAPDRWSKVVAAELTRRQYRFSSVIAGSRPAVNANPDLPTASFNWSYRLNKRDGGYTILLIDAIRKADVTFTAGACHYQWETPAHATAIIDMDKAGSPLAAFFAGRLVCNGQLLAATANNKPILLTSAAAGKSLLNTGTARLFADSPELVTTGNAVKNDFREYAPFFLQPDSRFSSLQRELAQSLKARGVALADSVATAKTVIRFSDSSRYILKRNDTASLVYDGRQLGTPWSGMIRVERGSTPIIVELSAPTSTGLKAVAARLAVAPALENCLIGPFMPLE